MSLVDRSASRLRRLRPFVRGAAVTLVAFVVLAFGVGCCVFSAPRYNGPRSDHFDGDQFANQVPVEEHGLSDLLKWQLSRERGSWRPYTDAPPGPPPPYRVGAGELRVTFVNHATTLIQLDGVNILTDPVWSERVSPLSFVGPRRVRPPGIRFEDLPPIDAVIISHNHYDHLDLTTIRRIQKAFPDARVFAGLGNSLLFAKSRVRNAKDLDWWQSAPLPNGVTLTAVPAQHFSNRGLCDRGANLWAGYVIQGSNGYVYFAGDTGTGPHFTQVREKFGTPRLAVLPIGAYKPLWFMAPIHISPAEAVQAHQTLGAEQSLAMHFGTFPLADDGQDDPVNDLNAALQQHNVSADRFWVLGFGEGRDVPRVGDTQ